VPIIKTTLLRVTAPAIPSAQTAICAAETAMPSVDTAKMLITNPTTDKIRIVIDKPSRAFALTAIVDALYYLLYRQLNNSKTTA
jgi:hypothetical protein